LPFPHAENDISLFYTPLLTRIIAYRNEFIFQEVWKRLPAPDREEFLEDLNGVEHDLMDSVKHFISSSTITS
jgi:transcription elongation factor GreA-like protein